MRRHKNKHVSIRQRARYLAAACIFSVTALCFAAPNMAFADEAERQFSAEIGAIVSDTLNVAKTDDFQAALDLLISLTDRPDLTPYEEATIYQMIGQYEYKLDRPRLAQMAFEKAYLSGGLRPHEAENITVVIAQLMIINNRYRDGAERLETYLQEGGEQKPQYIELLVNAWVQAEDYERALPWAQIWFDAADPKERKHYDLMNFLFNNLGLPERQEGIVKEMIEHWPDDKNLWDSWVSILAGHGREKEAFEVTKLAYSQGLITSERGLFRLIQYHAFYDMPYQAAEILEREIETGRISRSPERLKHLGSLFREARDYGRATPILEAAVREDIS